MASIKGTKTEVNILTAFAGEAQARNRYTFFASQAKKDGYVQVQHLFEETASQEKEHAERLFKFLEGGAVEIKASYPAGVIGSTIENLVEAANGEREEYSHMYPSFADVAEQEGFAAVASAMRHIAIAEKHHEQRYLELLNEIKTGTMFSKPEEIVWECLNCGYLHVGKEAPAACPACAHPQAYFAPNRSWV
ncbi:MAG: rubrerythrin family protein [Rickettsiales bacterium]|jgi:rubrerythrin|nr:rubrerythrin family protein [Rickettsiales bacterium]